MLAKLKHFWRQNDITIAAAIISFLLSITAYNSNNPINYDGILYLDTAKAYLKSGLSAAMEVYNWPFYSLLIAYLSSVTHLTLIHAAKLINCCLTALTAIAFINIVREFTMVRSIHFAAAITILLYPALNGYRDLIIRDFGYWTFVLIALWQLLRYIDTQSWRHALNWCVTIFVATLFRVEGIFLFLLAPCALLLLPQRNWPTRFRIFVKPLYIPIALLIVILVWRFNHSNVADNLGRLPEIIRALTQDWQLTLNFFHTKLSVVQNSILPVQANGDAILWLVCGFIGTFIAALIITLHPIFAALLGHSFFKQLLQGGRQQKLVLYIFAIINLANPLIFYMQHFFLSDRYLIAACLILLIWVPFSLDYLYRSLAAKRWLLWPFSIVLLIIGLSSVVHMGYSKTFITNAGNWLNNNTSPSANIYSNSQQILFYANRTPVDHKKVYATDNPLIGLQQDNWRRYDYVALWIKHSNISQESAIISLIGQSPIQKFANKRGDEVIIFKLK